MGGFSCRQSLCDVHSRQRLDARLWLKCRLAFVQSVDVNTSLAGKVGGTDDLLAHCRQGQKEAESLGDMETWLEFAFTIAVSLWLKCDKTREALEGFAVSCHSSTCVVSAC